MKDERGEILLRLARAAIAEALGLAAAPVPRAPFLDEPGATFVTLTQDGQLRGCIGSLEARRPLALDVRENALAAAFRDPRFAPLAPAEFSATRVEVSLLSPMQPMAVVDEDDALRQLRPGVDGLVLVYGGHRGTFLPQVWESLPEPQRFLRRLKVKAGLQSEFWAPEIQLFRYTVTKWQETGQSTAAA